MFVLSRVHLVRVVAIVTAIAVVPVFSACNKPRKVLLNKRQKKKIEDSVSDSEPKMQKMLNLQFDDRVRLVGVSLKQAKVKPGGSFTIQYAWHVTGVVDNTDWKIFVHVDGNGKPHLYDLRHDKVATVHAAVGTERRRDRLRTGRIRRGSCR